MTAFLLLRRAALEHVYLGEWHGGRPLLSTKIRQSEEACAAHTCTQVDMIARANGYGFRSPTRRTGLSRRGWMTAPTGDWPVPQRRRLDDPERPLQRQVQPADHFLQRTTPQVRRSTSVTGRAWPPTTKRAADVLSAMTLFEDPSLKSTIPAVDDLDTGADGDPSPPIPRRHDSRGRSSCFSTKGNFSSALARSAHPNIAPSAVAAHRREKARLTGSSTPIWHILACEVNHLRPDPLPEPVALQIRSWMA